MISIDELDDEQEGKPLSWLGDLDPRQLSALLGRSAVHPDLGTVWRKPYECAVEKDVADNGRLTFRISTGSEDRAGDTVAADGWYFKNYRKNPIVLFDHDYGVVGGSPPAQGKTVAYGVKDDALFATVEFHRKWKFNEELYQMYRGGYMKAASVGFWPLVRPEERDTSKGGRGFNFPKNDLLEWSLVAVPMNAEAYQLAARKGIIRQRTSEYLQALTTEIESQDSPNEHARAQEDEQITAATRKLAGATAAAIYLTRRNGA